MALHSDLSNSHLSSPMRAETPRAGPVLNAFLDKIQNQTPQKGKKRKREKDISYFDKGEKGLIINRVEKILQQKLVKMYP